MYVQLCLKKIYFHMSQEDMILSQVSQEDIILSHVYIYVCVVSLITKLFL